MTIVLLASVSLLALVVTTTSRPILADGDRVPTASTVQTAVQAVFHIHPGNDDPEPDFVPIKHQNVYFSETKAEVVPAIASLGNSLGIEHLSERPSSEVDGSNALDADNELDAFRADHADAEQADTEPGTGKQVVSIGKPPTAPFLVLVFSCAAGFLALACIALTLCIVKSLRTNILTSNAAWDLLSRFRRCPMSREDLSKTDKKHGCSLRTNVGPQFPLAVEEGSAEGHDRTAETMPLYLDVDSDTESEWDDADEKYQDALDMTPLPVLHDLPLEEHVSCQPLFELSLPSSVFCPLNPQTGPSPRMRELCPSPVSRPAWSVRAVDSPPLGLSSRETELDSTPQPLVHPRRRAYRSAVPEFDIALAMQLRPGLGIGADPAWMVRFLMTIFGWFAVALTGNTR